MKLTVSFVLAVAIAGLLIPCDASVRGRAVAASVPRPEKGEGDLALREDGLYTPVTGHVESSLEGDVGKSKEMPSGEQGAQVGCGSAERSSEAACSHYSRNPSHLRLMARANPGRDPAPSNPPYVGDYLQQSFEWHPSIPGFGNRFFNVRFKILPRREYLCILAPAPIILL